jgi:Tfp pilus assembly protein PilE
VGAFTLTIVSVPQVVNNDSTVQVVVKSSLSQAQASLLVTYDASPGVYFGKTVTTGGDGNATLNWKIRVNMFNNHTNATVRVVGQSQSGQQTQSAPVNVTVVGGNM